MKLLELIKNKKNEKEKIQKEQDKVKEEINKSAKSQSASRNQEQIHKFNNLSKSKEEENSKIINNTTTNKDEININININRDNNTSPKRIEIYNKKNTIKNNKFISNSKIMEIKLNNNIKNIEIKYKKSQSPKNIKTPKLNINNVNTMMSPSNRTLNRIVVNNKIKKNQDNPIINININKANLNNKKNIDNQNFQDVVNRYSNLGKKMIKSKDNKHKNEIQIINIKKTYEKPIFIYNKSRLTNRSVDMDNFESSNFLSSNKIIKKATVKRFTNNNHNIIKIYNPKKLQVDKVKSVEKVPDESNNKINKEYSFNDNYFYNYNNYYNNKKKYNNNFGINSIYLKKKSLFESNIETNASSRNL